MDKIEVKHVNFYYGNFQALKDISLNVREHEVTAFIGPSGCGKSTFLRLFNRMNDLIPGTRLEGAINIDGNNIYDKSVNIDLLRRNVEWSSNAQIRFLKVSMKTSHTVCA